MPRLSRLGFIDVDRTRMPVRRRIRSRGVPTALQDHEVLCTDDPVEAAEVVSDLLGPTRLMPAATVAEPFQATLNAVRFLDVTMAHLDVHCSATMAVNPSVDAYTVHMVTNGAARFAVDGVRREISAFFAPVISPGSDYLIALDADSPQLIVRIEKAAVERQLSRLLGRSLDVPVVFDPIADLTTDEAVRWHSAIHLLSSEIVSAQSLIHRGVAAGPIEDLIVSTLLYIHRSNYTDRLRTRARPSGRAAVRRSVEYIEAHLAERITLADLAGYARMSPRSIQQGFREDLRTTPVAYIRDLRLQRVRADLMQAMPGDGVTVTDVAERWGFGHLGNFSVLYRQRFGESPSKTLRR